MQCEVTIRDLNLYFCEIVKIYSTVLSYFNYSNIDCKLFITEIIY